MKAIAMLTPRLLQRVRAAVRPPASLSVRACTAELIDAVRRGWPDVALLDPTLVSEPGALVWPLREAHVGTVLYVYLTREYLAATIQLGQYLDVQVMTFGYNDDPSSLICALNCRGRSARGEILFGALAVHLAELPPFTRAGFHAANQREAELYSVRQLTSYCRVTRRVLALQLYQAGLRSVHSLLTALQLVRRYEVVSDKSIPLSTVALLVGVSSARTLERQCRSVSGRRIADIRGGLSLECFCDAIANQLSGSCNNCKPPDGTKADINSLCA
jgi:hypothetical protein